MSTKDKSRTRFEVGNYEATVWQPELSTQFAVALYYDGEKVGLTRYFSDIHEAKAIARIFVNSKCQ